MDQNPEMQGAKPPKQEAELANDRPDEHASDSSNHATTIVETVTTETIKEPRPSQQVSGPTATEIITETTTETTGDMPTQAAAAAKPKKSHKGLVALIVTLLVIIIAAVGAAVWYFVYYSNPDKVAYDAITKFLQEKTVIANGTVTGVINAGDKDISLVAGVNSKNNGLAGENILSVKAMALDANGEPISENDYEVELGAMILEDGIIYIRTGKVMETFDLILDDMSVEVDELDDSMSAIYKLLNNIDGEWWQIDVPDVIDTVIGKSEIASSAKEFYACIINVANEGVNSQLAGVYRNNQFVNLQKSSTLSSSSDIIEYSVDIDYDKLASFMGDMVETDYIKSTENCLNKFIVEDLGGNITFDHTIPSAEEIKKEVSQLDIQTIGITNFGHELKTLSISYHPDKDDYDTYYINGGFEFAHPEVTVTAPEKYRPISDLVELIIETLMEMDGVPSEDLDNGGSFEYDEETDEWYFIDEEIGDDTNEV